MDEKQPDPAKLCAAVKAHLCRCPFWTEANSVAIVRDVGEAGLAAIQGANQYAYDQTDAWLESPNLGEASMIVRQRLAEHYPDWDSEAIRIIVNYASYSWR